MRGWRKNGALLATESLQPAHNLAKLSAGILPELQFDTGSQGGNPSDVSSSLPTVEVRPSPGKGFGLFAVNAVPAYTKVLEDEALLSLAQGEDFLELWEKYCLLQPELKQVFDDLSYPSEVVDKEKAIIAALERRGYESCKASKMARVNLRWQANSFSTGSQKWLYSLFPFVSRINHSCTPNACAHYNDSGTQVVFALRDIEAGQEIEITYFDITMTLSDRQTEAKSWGFQCLCAACSNTGELAGTEYEHHLYHVHQHFTESSPNLDSEALTDSLQDAISISQSSEYPWLILALPKLYLSLFNMELRAKGRTPTARRALEKVLEWEEKTTGPESRFSQERRKKLIDFDAGKLEP